MRVSSSGWVLASLLSGAAFAAAPSESFPVAKHGAVQLDVPNGWVSELHQPPDQSPPTITLRPKDGKAFVVLISPYWRGGADRTVYESTLREQTEAAAAKAQLQSVEAKLTLNEVRGADGLGYYFSATDRAPNPGEYRYMTQGIMKLSDLALAFTVLTNDGQADVVANALQLLTTAKRK